MTAQKKNLGALTGIRFIAAMLVYFYHFGAGFSERIGAPALLTNLLKNGYFGVSIFFVLSGFILYYNYQDSVRSAGAFKHYLVARIARIYPVYVLILILALPVTTRPTDAYSVLRVLTMTQSWALPSSDLGFAWVTQAWTLSVELFFYLLFPLYAYVVARSTALQAIVLACICVAAIVLGQLSTIAPSTLPGQIPEWAMATPLPVDRTFEFVFGVALARLHLQRSTPRFNLSASVVSLALCGAIVAVLCLAISRLNVAVATVLSGLLIYQLAAGNCVVSRLLSTKIMVFAGGASYSLYLLQGPVHDFVKGLPLGGLAPAIQLVLVLVAAALIFKFYEEPARRLIRAKTT